MSRTRTFAPPVLLLALFLGAPLDASPQERPAPEDPLRAQGQEASRPDAGPILGFTAEGATEQHALEARYDGHILASDLRDWMERMTSKPIHVGSPGQRENAEWLLERFREWGFDARIETFHVLFPTPRTRVLELVAPDTFTARLAEPPVEGDATSSLTEGRLPPYNAYSADGDVTAELVYVNYGIPEDYEELKRRGIDVEGKVVIARYGRSWRGIKPKVAAEHGAVGAILYSDPREDGYFQGDVYPEGPFKPEHGAQRGSVLDMPRYPGDPLTPGVGATEDAERMSPEESPTIMDIPVLPISWADARPLLEALGGPVAPESWRGALPLTYHIGPGPARVHLELAFDWDTVPAHDVIAVLRGSEWPEQWVVRGNHMDAWAFGADDPISGLVALMAEAKAVGELAREGWRPRRTIVYAGWDAEEPGLLGSTEWAERHAEELREKAAAYLNTDSNGRGFLYLLGSHTLERFVNQVARDVTDPQTGVSVARRVRAGRAVRGEEEALEREDLRVEPLGSGSDYTPFLQHLGIASLHLGFGGESEGGAYHSAYDSFDHYTRFGDPGFEYGIALAKTAGRATLRLAGAPVLPYRFANFADAVSRYLEEVVALADEEREETERENRLVREEAYRLAADPTEEYVPPEAEEAVPHLEFAPLRNAVAAVEEAAAAYDSTLEARLGEGAPAGETARRLNEALIGVERAMTREEGLPGRSWFRHQVYAPGFYTGYGVKTLPGVREAIEEREWALAEEQARVLAATLRDVAGAIGDARAILSGASPGGSRAGGAGP